MKPTKKSDGELIEDFLQGNQTAFEELVYRYQSAVYGLAGVFKRKYTVSSIKYNSKPYIFVEKSLKDHR